MEKGKKHVMNLTEDELSNRVKNVSYESLSTLFDINEMIRKSDKDTLADCKQLIKNISERIRKGDKRIYTQLLFDSDSSYVEDCKKFRK